MPTQIQWRRGNTAQTAVFTGAVGEITVDTTKNTLVVHDGVTSGGFPLALESAQQDALAYAHANSAHQTANSGSSYANSAFLHANAAYASSNTKFSSTGGTISGDVSVAGNVIPTTDNDKYLGSASYRWHSLYVGPGTVNIGGISLSNVANKLTISGAETISVAGTVDTSSISNHANAAFNTANTALLSTGAFAQANAAYLQANAAYAQANTGTILAQAAFDSANNVAPQIQPSYNHANAAFNAANTADQRAVTSGSYANSAYSLANTKFSSSGGTITGSVTISGGDLTVSGNLVISGNTTSVSANNLVVNDTMIYLANNATGNTSDIGIVGHFIEGTYQHTGVVRDATDGKWKFFSNVATEPSGTTLDFTGAYYDTVKVGIIEADTASINGVNLGSHTQSAYNTANTASVNALSAGSYANSAYTKANTSLQNNASGSTTGTIYAAGLSSNTSVTMNTNAVLTSTAITTGSVSQVTADSWATATYRSAKYFVQITSSTSYHVLELSVLHDGTTVYIVTYGEQFTSSSLGSFDATITTGTLSLLFTPTNATTTAKLFRTLIPV